MTIRVLVVDDHAAARVDTRTVLKKTTGISVVGEAADGKEALRLVEELRPDVAVVDCRLPEMEGPQVAQAIRAAELPTRVLALSAYADDHHVHGMLRAGAAGYLLKEEMREKVVEAVRAVARGEEWYSQEIVTRVAAWRCSASASFEGAGLTEQEIAILRLMARGWEDGHIAIELGLELQVVEHHVESIYARLGICSRAKAVTWAWEQGVVD